MTWTASETPKDIAQQGDSLVASILREQQASTNSKPTAEDLPAVTPQWMRWHLEQLVLRQRLRMNLGRRSC